MNKSVWIFLFLFILLVDVAAALFNQPAVRYAAKPLLMPLLAGYLVTETRGYVSQLKLWILLALFFSWAGDILLIFDKEDPIFFLLGLSAFFLAQVFYIVFFHNIRMREYIRGNSLLLLIVVVYYAILINLLSPHLGKMNIPVEVYGVVLSFMLMLAMHMALGKFKRAGRWMMAGAILFVASDSMLAFDKFYMSFDFANVLIMLTYGLGQLFISKGAVLYLRRSIDVQN